MSKRYYPIDLLESIINYHLQNYHYLGTGDNCELVFKNSSNKCQYIIFTLYCDYFIISREDIQT